MKTVFMGTPQFAVGCLNSLIETGHEVAAVFSQPDKPVGRKKVLTPSAVKQCALGHNIRVYQPDTLRCDETIDLLRTLAPDVIAVVAYGKLLPTEILQLPRYGCINVHASILPKYRGASPIQSAIVNGETQTGVTTMLLDEGMDTGDILLSEKIPITTKDTFESLSASLADIGARLLIKTLKKLEGNELVPQKQDELSASYAPIINKEDGLIDWKSSAFKISCQIRGLHSWPVAYSMLNKKRLKIYECETCCEKYGSFGMITVKNDCLYVSCGDGSIKITELQLEGSKRMSAASFINGRKIDGEMLSGD